MIKPALLRRVYEPCQLAEPGKLGLGLKLCVTGRAVERAATPARIYTHASRIPDLGETVASTIKTLPGQVLSVSYEHARATFKPYELIDDLGFTVGPRSSFRDRTTLYRRYLLLTARSTESKDDNTLDFVPSEHPDLGFLSGDRLDWRVGKAVLIDWNSRGEVAINLGLPAVGVALAELTDGKQLNVRPPRILQRVSVMQKASQFPSLKTSSEGVLILPNTEKILHDSGEGLFKPVDEQHVQRVGGQESRYVSELAQRIKKTWEYAIAIFATQPADADDTLIATFPGTEGAITLHARGQMPDVNALATNFARAHLWRKSMADLTFTIATQSRLAFNPERESQAPPTISVEYDPLADEFWLSQSRISGTTVPFAPLIETTATRNLRQGP